jgi:hypothetical protein
MLFVLRAIFWLSLVAWLMSPRSGEEVAAQLARDTLDGAVDYCSVNTATCLDVAQKLHERGSSLLQPQQAATMPYPLPRPISLTEAAGHRDASVLSRMDDDIAGRGPAR